MVKALIPVNILRARENDDSIQKDSNRKFWSRVVNEIKELRTIPFADSFRECRSYLNWLVKENPGSQMSYECTKNWEGQICFGRVAIMLSSQINMVEGAKPVISFDSGFMKHPMWGSYQILVCGGQDGNNKDLLFAIALVPVESEANYKFLMETMLKDEKMANFLKQDGLIVVTDRKKGLMNAVESMLEGAVHRYCALHLLGNIKGPAFTSEQRSLNWSIVFATTKVEFDKRMGDLKKSHPVAYDYLSKLETNLWANVGYRC